MNPTSPTRPCHAPVTLGANPTLFVTLRDQPDSTRFSFTLEVGFNPIQPYPTRQPKIISFSFYCVVFVFPRISKVKSKVVHSFIAIVYSC